MFFIGGLPALLAVYVRFGVTESEVWKKTKSQNWSHLGRAVVSHWKLFLLIFAMMTAMNFVSHGTQDLYPTFLKVQRGFDAIHVAYMGIVYNIGAILGGLVVGRYSDFRGRRRSMITSLLLAVVVLPLWVLAPGTALLATGAFVMQFMVQGAWGVVPAHINELTPDSVRGFLPGFAYQCGVAVAGVAPTLQEHFAKQYSMAWVMALSCGIAFLVAALVIKLGHEKRGMEFGVIDR
jgi:SHS family lactate transporter-like MFS transporter